MRQKVESVERNMVLTILRTAGVVTLIEDRDIVIALQAIFSDRERQMRSNKQPTPEPIQ